MNTENESVNESHAMWCKITCIAPEMHKSSYIGVSDTIIIGRSSTADIVLPSSWISGVHAIIRRHKAGANQKVIATIEDTSTNGTEVNDDGLLKRVPHALSTGDHISFGSRRGANYEFYFKLCTSDDGHEGPVASKGLQLHGIAARKYDATRLIGKGRYGAVYNVTHKKSGQCCALKVVNPLLCKHDREMSFRIAMREVEALRATQGHPGIIRLIEHDFQHPDYYIALELAKFGDLYNVFGDLPPDESTVCSIFAQLLSAVRYLHEKNLVHRDIKRGNVVIVARDPEIVVKLADFGVVALCVNGNIDAPLGGTTSYLSPEAVERCNGQQHLQKSRKLPCGKPCDMWSLGVLLYFMLFGVPPFIGDDENKLCAAIHTGIIKYPPNAHENTSEGAIDMINSLLVRDQTARHTVHQALRHTWVTDHLQWMLTSVSPELVAIAELEVSQNEKVA